jgi:hypothetical protein
VSPGAPSFPRNTGGPLRSCLTGAATLAAALLLTPLPGPLLAQSGTRWIGASGAAAWTRGAGPDSAEALRGTLAGIEGRLTLGRLGFLVGYTEGRLEPDTAGPSGRDVVEGFALLTAKLLSGLEVAAGPRARAYESKSGLTRWVFWELRARLDAPVGTRAARAYVEFRGAVSGQVNAPQPFQHGFGGEAGLLIRLGQGPLGARLGYAIDEARLDASRRETVETVTFTVVYGRW